MHQLQGSEGHRVSTFVPLHKGKDRTPGLGGVVIFLSILLNAVVFCDWRCVPLQYGMLLCFLFALLGLYDDLLKWYYKNNVGMWGRSKIFWQLLCSLGTLYLFGKNCGHDFIGPNLIIPFIDEKFILSFMSWCFWGGLVTSGSSNAFNITDGLDGLAAGIAFFCWLGFAVIFFCISQGVSLNYHTLNLVTFFDAQEIFVWSGSFVGTCAGFLYLNSYPAKVFMSDVGSSFLGAIMGWLAIVFQIEFFWCLSGILYALDICSCVLQYATHKIFKRKLFPMAPIHHAFEKKMHETQVVFWAYVITMVVCGVGVWMMRG